MSINGNLNPKRILIVKPSAIGDVVHTLPVLNLLRRRYPDAHIAWLVTPACGGILDGHPQLNELIWFERKRAGGWIKLLKLLRADHFDLVLDLQGLFRSGLFSWMSGAKVRVGFANARELATLFYTHKVPVPDVNVHAMERYLDMAEAVGCERGPVQYVFPTTDADRERVRTMLGDDEPYAVLLPGTNWVTKRWPAEKFAELVPSLYERFGLKSVYAGGKDASNASRIAEKCAQLNGESAGSPGGAEGSAISVAAYRKVVDLTGKTSLRELVGLLERASLVIANDSGPMHIAAALGRPLVTLFGPTHPVRTGPYRRLDSVVRLDIPCSPCYSKTCSHQSCLQWLGTDRVLAAAARQLGQDTTVPLPVLR